MSFYKDCPGNDKAGWVRRLFLLSILTSLLILVFCSGTAVADPGDEWVFGSDSPVAPDTEPQQTSSVSGNYVVWQGRRNVNGSFIDTIFFKDISSPSYPVKILVEKSAHQSRPVISGNMVIWLEGGTVKQIHYTYIENDCPFNVSCIDHTLPISSQARPYEPDLYKDDTRNLVVWEDWRGGNKQKDIYMYDLNAGQELVVCNASSNQERPSIEGDWIAYMDNRGGTYTYGTPTKNDIWARNITTWEERRVTFDERAIMQSNPAISGNKLVYDGNGIWFYDFSLPDPPRQISTNGQRPDIDGNVIAWEVSPSTAHQIDMHDLGTSITQHVSMGQGTVLHPAVSGSYIVWSDDRDGVRNLYHNRLRDKASDLAARFQPELHIAADDYIPTLVDLMTDIQFVNYNGQNRTVFYKYASGGEVDRIDPAVGMISSGALGNYNEANYPRSTWDFDLDLSGNRTDGDRHINDYRYWRNKYQGGQKSKYPATVYARVARDLDLASGNRKTSIQYWLCYYYNDVVDNTYKHEGDWEVIQIDLDENLEPVNTVFSQHDAGKERGWSDVFKNGDRVMAFVSEGTHANYYTIDAELDANSIADKPAISLINEEPDLRMIDYPSTPWLGYYGFWGAKDSAPRGPKYNTLCGNDNLGCQWNDPLNWGGKKEREEVSSDSISLYTQYYEGIGSMTSSLNTSESRSTPNPLNVLNASSGLPISVSLYDSLNNRTGMSPDGAIYEEIPNSEYLKWNDGAGTAIVHAADIGMGYIVELDKPDSNAMTIKLSLPVYSQNHLDQPEYVLDSPASLKGRVMVAPVGSVQDYTMYLDTDADGIFDDGSIIPTNTSKDIDYIYPGAISDLAISNIASGSATLAWTASGEDGIVGQALQYDIRYSKSAIIDEYSWNNADLVFDEPTPQAAGSDEIFTIEGLPGGDYYFAIRARDDVNHESAISNTVYSSVPAFHFEDDFEDGNADNWAPHDPVSWNVMADGGNFKYQTVNTTTSSSWTGPSALTDQYIEADVKIISGSTAGLLFRGSGDMSSGSYYYFGIYPSEGKWKLYSVKQGWWGDENHNPQACGDFIFLYDETCRLKASAQGEQITLSINNQMLSGGQLTLSDNPSGKIGLLTNNGEAMFDNVTVGGSPW